ncbi:EexN family lipoprotein [Brevundimonas albigilva]|uniref:EexN family lipoprotein n=1 Tax=Brevundimonas albigilva TaxID=1312364 RepID=UPI00201B55A8|nr:EexN family lipoprotein [Brevundimonas albigilva]UQV18941.1 EexN family lipoprotein [Brevundimonas albigilva]
MRRSALLVALGLVGCGTPERTAEDFAADPDAAEAVVAACDAGRTQTECDAARRGLAEARRDARMRAYVQAF